ncbi:anti-sigma factor [Croceitalea rosinachiae]|uniref:Anti-sigma factor n=1 Tax=Croceitalea rosinachiae TaxID=3075596 RepID=A0ABU3AEF8_9FLAO|nr:anti-sigma factor [Croceitalea sp. F388]MDT0608295.1 anti-sigma factor [Croceitalea sp. F388]
MDRKKILEEGLLEKYLLDELSAEERQQVGMAIDNDKGLKKQFELLEEDFEKMALENAIDPPTRVKMRLIEQLQGSNVKTMPKTWLYAAASLALLFLLSSFWMFNRWKSAELNFESLQNQTTVLQERLNALEENYLLTNQRLKTINGPQTIPLILHGNELVPNSRAVAYVNHENKMVVVNAQGLPELPENNTYQMWSDVDGEMINMGLLPTDQELITLKYIDKAESLNITIEPAGGNDHPTVEKLIAYVTL